MRPFLFPVAVLMLAAGLWAPAFAQANVEAIRYIAVPSDGPVVLNNVTSAGPIVDSFRDIGPAQMACAAFTNNDTRTAKSVRIQFVYYDGNGDRTDGALLTRNGTFSTGVRAYAAAKNGRIYADACLRLHRPRNNFSAVVAYIDRVDFSDGSTWSATQVRFAKHVTPGSRNVAYDFTDEAAAPLMLPAPPGELAPLVLGSVATCAQGEAELQAAGTPFDPAVVQATGLGRNVYVDVRPGTPAVGALFDLGAETLCKPSGNPAHDSAALEAVRDTHISIRQEQIFRTFFPAVSTSTACNDGARILNRVLLSATPTIEVLAPAKTGEYIAVARVDVGSDGRATAAVITRSARPPEFNDATVRGALASRYWPAIAAGKPVAGVFEFATRWVIEPAPEPENINVPIAGSRVSSDRHTNLPPQAALPNRRRAAQRPSATLVITKIARGNRSNDKRFGLSLDSLGMTRDARDDGGVLLRRIEPIVFALNSR